jgi:hypothetical protein
LIQAIDYQGDDAVTITEVLERFAQRRIRLRPETLYREDDLGRATAVVKELLAEKGRPNSTITPVVEPMGPPLTWPPASVKITFAVDKKQ